MATVREPDPKAMTLGRPRDQKSRLMTTPPDLDGGWAWVVLGATFLAFLIMSGLWYSSGIYYVAFLEEFQESKSYTAWIGATHSAVFNFAGPISSVLLPYAGARWTLFCGAFILALAYGLLAIVNSIIQVIVIYGIFGGIGSSMVLMGSIAAVVQYFNTRLYIASGIMYAGGGLGTLVVGLLGEFLVDHYGWRGSLLILSGLALQICICATLVFAAIVPRQASKCLEANGHGDVGTAPQEMELLTNTLTIPSRDSSTYQPANTSNRQYFKDVLFWLFVLIIMAFHLASTSVFVFFKDILIHKGLEATFKSFVMCIGIGSMIGRLISGLVTTYVDPTFCFFLIGTLNATTVFLLKDASSEWSVLTIAPLFGFSHGVLSVSQSLMVAHVFGRPQMAIIGGYIMGASGIGVLIGPPLGGLITDKTGNYGGSIILYSTTFFFSAIVSLLVYVINYRRNKA